MSKKNMLNISVESVGTDNYDLASAAAPTAVVVPSAPVDPVVLPVAQPQGDDVARLKAIADAIDDVADTLGARVAQVGIATVGVNTVVSTEAISLASIGATVKKYVMMAIDFIKRFVVAVINYGARYIEKLRYNRKEMADLLRDVTNFMRARRGDTFTIEGTSVTLLQINGVVPAGPAELARAFNEFRRDVDGPYMDWLKNATGKVEEVSNIMNSIFKAESLLKADAGLFTQLEQIKCAAAPNGWKRDVSVGSGLWSYVPKVPTWGGVRVNVVGDETVNAADVSASMVSPFDAPDNESTITIGGDLLTEYAKLGMGVVDLQVNLAGPYDAVRQLSKRMLDNYTTKFVGVDDKALTPTDQQTIATRNSQINDAMGYLSFVMSSTANYMSYLTALRGAIQQTLSAVIEPPVA